MQIIGVDLHARQQTVAMLNVETGEIVGEDFAARRRFGARVLLDSCWTDSCGDRSHRFDAVVPGVDGGVGDRLPGGPSSEDPRGRTAETKARSKRCRAGVAVAG